MSHHRCGHLIFGNIFRDDTECILAAKDSLAIGNSISIALMHNPGIHIMHEISSRSE